MEETIGQILAQIQIDTLAEWEREVVKEFLQRGHSPREALQLLGYNLLP